MTKNALAIVYKRTAIESNREEDEDVTLYEYTPCDIVCGFELDEYNKRKFFVDDDTELPYIEDIIDINEEFVYAFPCYTSGMRESEKDKLLEQLYDEFDQTTEKYKLIQLYAETDKELITLATPDGKTFAKINPSNYEGHNRMTIAKYMPISKGGESFSTGITVSERAEEKKDIKKTSDDFELLKTTDMFEHISSSVICQDEPIKSIVTGFAKNQKITKAVRENPETREALIEAKQSFLVCGSTGVGKTAIFKSLAAYAGVPITFEDASQYTMEGYVGQSPMEILRNLIREADGDIGLAERGIVVLDEFDKKAACKDVSPAMTTEVQSSLLTMMTGHKYRIKSLSRGHEDDVTTFDTSTVTFALLGAYSGIEEFYEKKSSNMGFGADVVKKGTIEDYSSLYTPENLTKYGIKPELLGRTNIVALKSLEIEDMCRIIEESDKSPIKLNQLIYALMGINLIIDREAIEELAKKAVTYKAGARGIKKAVDEILCVSEFEIFGDNSPKEVIITKETLEDPKKLVLRY